MKKSTEILQLEFELIKQDLIDKHNQLGMRASGDWANSLHVEAKGLTATIFGNSYTEQLVNGRGPGKFPPISAITQWISDKNIPLVDITISSLAFLIARKIAREGTQYFKKGGTDLISSVITPQRIQRIIDSVSEFHINSFVSDITNVFKEVA